MMKAADFLSDDADYKPKGTDFLNYITRDATPAYFKTIYNLKNAVVVTELKDGDGSPKNPINWRLSGLFFSAKVVFIVYRFLCTSA